MPAHRTAVGSHLLTAGIVAVIALYAITWRLLVDLGGDASWLGPVWLAETYLLLACAYYVGIVRPARRRQQRDRRKLPRVSVAMPMRFSTEEGRVGVGVLVDVNQDGAGLLIPRMPFAGDRVWLQSAWFDDRIGMQGRVMYTRETADGLRLGLHLHPVHPETVALISDVLIPIGRRGVTENGQRPVAARLGRWLGAGHASSPPKTYHFPVRVEQGSAKFWAITESMDSGGAVLILPRALTPGAPLRVAVWGGQQTHAARLLRMEPLKVQGLAMHRVTVQFASAGLPQVDPSLPHRAVALTAAQAAAPAANQTSPTV